MWLVVTSLDSAALESNHTEKHFYHIDSYMIDCNQCDVRGTNPVL